MPIHLYEQIGGITPIGFENKPTNFFESHAWAGMTDQTANDLVGDYIFFHKKKNTPAREGGIIQHWERNADGRVVFVYEGDTALRGHPAPKKGAWNRNDWCIV